MDLPAARTQCIESGGAIPDPEQQDSFDFDTTRHGAWEDHSNILKVAKNLTKARIFVSDADTPRLIPGGVIELCELRRLFLSDVDILHSLRLPALQDLGFLQEVGDPDAAPHVDSVVVRSSCILQRLCVMGFPGADMITELLQKHQAIVELSVILADPDSSVNANALIGYLANRGSDGIFSIAPQLGELGTFFIFQKFPRREGDKASRILRRKGFPVFFDFLIIPKVPVHSQYRMNSSRPKVGQGLLLQFPTHQNVRDLPEAGIYMVQCPGELEPTKGRARNESAGSTGNSIGCLGI
ncbi:hypothetical protein B0H13DRAFT_1906881 [Mycena leptocephala]|nr:hypothetical protein B0H13DRAFT_1906881 [Mycena leptocephala]